MTTLPPITVSQLDRNRLYALLERLDDESEQIEFLYQTRQIDENLRLN